MTRRHRPMLALIPVVAGLVALAGCQERGGESTLGAATTADVPAFDGDSAYALLRKQVSFGPRVPGSPGHEQQLAWMTERLRALADTLEVQNFAFQVEDGPELALTNLFARFNPTATDRILLLTHWDTRPTADQESDEAKRKQPIDGANDGASGTAVLLQLASLLHSQPPPIGVDLLFVDGEDYGPGDDNMYIGARQFAANLPPGYKPLYGILLDMVGDRSPLFPIEPSSQQFAPEVVERVWRTAEQLGYGAIFPRSTGISITDDHIPLNRAGIRTIDIIDFEYGPGNRYWHTLGDSVEHTSATGLKAVGQVVTALIYRGG